MRLLETKKKIFWDIVELHVVEIFGPILRHLCKFTLFGGKSVN